MTRRIVDLPAPFVPSSATHLAAVDLEVDVEEHLHRAVREVDVRDLEHRRRARLRSTRLRCSSCSSSSSSTTSERSWRMKRAPFISSSAADDARRDAEDEHRAAHADRVGEEVGEDAAARSRR